MNITPSPELKRFVEAKIGNGRDATARRRGARGRPADGGAGTG